MLRRRAAALCLLLLASSAAAQTRGRLRGERSEPPPEPAAVPLHPPRVATEPVTFVWPPEGYALSGEATFVLGSVASSTVPFRINGTTVPVHKDGGFIAFLPISAGTFTFRAELDLPTGSTATERRILVQAPVPLPADELALDESSLWPRQDVELRAGDWLALRVRGTPGKTARARVFGEWRGLRESSPGVYDLAWPVAAGEEHGPEAVEYELKAGWSKEKGRSQGRVSVAARTAWLASIKPNANGFIAVKTNPGNGFLSYPPPGVRLPVTGREGSFLRVQLHQGLSGWVEAKDVELSSGAAPPRAFSDTIGVVALSSSSIVRISLTSRVAFAGTVDDDLGGMTLRLFGVSGHTNWVIYDSKDELVDDVRWSQEATDVMAVRVRLKPGRRLWGWNASYDGPGSSLRLELRRAPRVDPNRPLAGVRVMLDPGHMPSATGATGPLGTKEMDANYAIAEAVAERIRRDGAVVLVTRGGPDHELGLAERPRMAVERGADLFVSLHNNALPDGTNPFAKPRGFTIFYYHPQSLELARNVHRGFRVRVPLPDEGLQWGNLAVARLTAMPAILVENAYMILPEQEALLNDPRFRAKLADAVADGLRETMREAGRKRP
jgi:N-acetylmuramoyl-L-alanine amidase